MKKSSIYQMIFNIEMPVSVVAPLRHTSAMEHIQIVKDEHRLARYQHSWPWSR